MLSPGFKSSEWRFVAICVIAMTVTTSLPYLFGYIISPADKIFMGMTRSDVAQYMAWMKGFTTANLIDNHLTPEPNASVFFNLLWWVLAKLTVILPLSPIAVIHLYRVFSIVVFMVVLYWFIGLCMPDRQQRRGAFWVACFGGGLGWIWVVAKYTFAKGEILFRRDVYTVEANSFQCLMGINHLSISATLMMLIYALLILGCERRQWRYPLLASLMALILGWEHAYDLLLVYAVSGIFVFILFLAGFIATLLLNQSLWMEVALVSATPKAFAGVLFVAFLYYLLRRSLPLFLVAIALQGLFFAPVMFISAGVLILQLLRWKGGRLRLSWDRSDYLLCATGLGVALLVILPYVLKSSEFGPLVTRAEARELPDFLPGGRQPFFRDNPLKFWLTGASGIFPAGWLRMRLPLIFAGLLLPILLRYPARFPLARQVTSEVALLPRIVVASLGLFFAAHVFFFRLYFPNRYTVHSLPVVMALASGIALAVMLDAVFHWAKQRAKPRPHGRQLLALGTTAMVGAVLILQPVYLKLTNYPFPRTDYVVGEVPPLYKFFAQQPSSNRGSGKTGAGNYPGLVKC